MGERLFIDISSIRHESIGGSKFWLLTLDDFSDHAWSYFLKRKSDQVSILIELVKDLKAKQNITVKII